MSDKLKKILSGIGVLAAFGLGGAAIAAAQGDKSVDNAAASQQGDAQSEAGEQGKAGEQGNAGEQGEKPDSAAEQAIDAKTAYSVEVRKSDGSTVDVALDDAFTVLGTEKGDHQEGQHEDHESATETAGR